MSISQVEVSVKAEDQVLTSTLLEYYKIRRLEIRYKNKSGEWEVLEEDHVFDVRKPFTVEITSLSTESDEYNPIYNNIYLHLTADNVNQGAVKYNYSKGSRVIPEYNELEDEWVDQTLPTMIIEVTPDLYVNENTYTPLGIYSAEGVLIKEVPVLIKAPQIVDAFIFPKNQTAAIYRDEVTISERRVYCIAFAANFDAADLYLETLEANKGLYKYDLVLSDIVIEGYQVYQLVPNPKLLTEQTGDYVMSSPVVVDESYYEHSLSQWITQINVKDDSYIGYNVTQAYPENSPDTLVMGGDLGILTIEAAAGGGFLFDDVLRVEATVADTTAVDPNVLWLPDYVNVVKGTNSSRVSISPPSRAALIKPTTINIRLVSENNPDFDETYQFKLEPNIIWDMRWRDQEYGDTFEVFRPSMTKDSDLLFKFSNWDFNLAPEPNIILGLRITGSSTSLDGETPTDALGYIGNNIRSQAETSIPRGLSIGYCPPGYMSTANGDQLGSFYLGEIVAKIIVANVGEYFSRIPKRFVLSGDLSLDTIKVNGLPITTDYKIKYLDQLSFDLPDTVMARDGLGPINVKTFMTVEHLQNDGTYTVPQVITDKFDVNMSNNVPILTDWQVAEPGENSEANPVTYQGAPYGSLRWYNYNNFTKVRVTIYYMPLISYNFKYYVDNFNSLDLSPEKLSTYAKVIYQNTFDYQDTKTPPVVAIDNPTNDDVPVNSNGITDASKPISTNIRVRGCVGDAITVIASEVLNSDKLSFRDDVEAKERLITSVENNTYAGLSFTPIIVTVGSGNLDKYGMVNFNNRPVNVSPVSKVNVKNHNVIDGLDKPLRNDISFHARTVRDGTVIWSEKTPVNSNRIDLDSRNAILVGKVDSTSVMGLQVGVKFFSTGVYKFKIHRVVALEWLDYDIDAILREYGNPQFTFGETVLETDEDGYVVLFKPDTLSAFNFGEGHKLNFRFGLEIEPVDDTQDYTNVPDKTQLTRVICGDVPDLVYPKGLFTNYVPLPEALNNIVIKSHTAGRNLVGLEDTLEDGFTPYLATASTGTRGVGNLTSTCNYYLLISTKSGVKVDDPIQIDFGDVESSLGVSYQTNLTNSSIFNKVVNGINGWRLIYLEGVKVASASAGKPLMHVFNKRTGALLKTMMTPLYKDPRLAPAMLNGDAIQAGMVTTGDDDATYLKALATNGEYYHHHQLPTTSRFQLTSFYNETNQTVTVNLLVHSHKLLTGRTISITGTTTPRNKYQSPLTFEQLPNNFILGKAIINVPDSEIASGSSKSYDMRINEVITEGSYPELSVAYTLNVMRPNTVASWNVSVRSSNMSNFVELSLKPDLTGPVPRFVVEGGIPVGFLFDENNPWGTNYHYIEYKFRNVYLIGGLTNGFLTNYSVTEPPILSPLLLTDQWTGNSNGMSSGAEESSVKAYGVLNGTTKELPPIAFHDSPGMTISPNLSALESGNALYLSVKQNVDGVWKIPAKDELFTLTNTSLTDDKLYEFKIALSITQNTATPVTSYMQVVNQRTGIPLAFYADAAGTNPLFINQISNDPANPTSMWISLPAHLCTYDVVSIKVWDNSSPAEARFNIVIRNLLRAVV